MVVLAVGCVLALAEKLGVCGRLGGDTAGTGDSD